MANNSKYEVTVYNTETEAISYEKVSDSFIVAAPIVRKLETGQTVHDVRLMINELHPKVTAHICLALIQNDPLAKQIFMQAMRNIIEKEGGN